MRTFLIGRGDWCLKVKVGRRGELADILAAHGCTSPGVTDRVWRNGTLEARGWRGLNICEVLP